MLLKRILDIIVSGTALLVSAPIMLFVAIMVRISMGSPVLFKQTRTGLKGALFTIYKFRTMKDACDTEGNPLPDEERLTGFGKFLRKTSLDELPQLWNVLKGQMSLVGPRPLLPEYLPLYSEEQMRRHDVIPGITGWAQVNGRNCVEWEKRFEMDIWYVDNWSFMLDLKIIFKTFAKVTGTQGVNAEGHATMAPFTGNKKD